MATTETSPLVTTEEFAQKLFRELQQLILQHEAGALAGDVESVHDMRVGIRRLRVAINNFAACLRKKERRCWRRRLENMADALGGVRDLDVMIEAMKGYQIAQTEGRTKEDLATFTAFISRLRSRRRRAMQNLRAYLGGEEYSEFKQSFSPEDRRAVSDLKEAQNEQAA